MMDNATNQKLTILSIAEELSPKLLSESELQTRVKEVLLADDALKALEILDNRGNDIDLILIDVFLSPEIAGRQVDGFHLAAFIKEKGFKAAIVMLSNVDITLLKKTQEKYKSVIDAFYRKPLTTQELTGLIKRHALKKRNTDKA